MDLVLLDDSAQSKPRRPGLPPLRAVGGLYVPGNAAGVLESSIHDLKQRAGFRGDAYFGECKWKPNRDQWMDAGLRGDDRTQFQIALVDLLVKSGCEAVVAVRTEATPRSVVWHDAFRMSHDLLRERETSGVIITDRPSDGCEKPFLRACLDSTGTLAKHPRIRGLVLTPSMADSSHVGLMQAADMVVGATLATIAGVGYSAPTVFGAVKALMPTPHIDIPRGGRRLLLEPEDLSNLYFWLLDDRVLVRNAQPIGLPSEGFPYYTSAVEP